VDEVNDTWPTFQLRHLAAQGKATSGDRRARGHATVVVSRGSRAAANRSGMVAGSRTPPSGPWTARDAVRPRSARRATRKGHDPRARCRIGEHLAPCASGRVGGRQVRVVAGCIPGSGGPLEGMWSRPFVFVWRPDAPRRRLRVSAGSLRSGVVAGHRRVDQTSSLAEQCWQTAGV
jgi:hypothetical protein